MINQEIDNLDALKTYYFRLYAKNGAGTAYGDTLSFMTQPISVVVICLPTTGITESSASLNGEIINDAGLPCNIRFNYGMDTNYGDNTKWQDNVRMGATFSAFVNDIGAGKVIHFRIEAQNANGTYYSQDATFLTPSFATALVFGAEAAVQEEF